MKPITALDRRANQIALTYFSLRTRFPYLVNVQCAYADLIPFEERVKRKNKSVCRKKMRDQTFLQAAGDGVSASRCFGNNNN